jgi:DNA-binding transcriptional MerR regulator
MIAIGEFSRITHLSIRTLRHYHEVGLLEPAEVDPGSGYRHYTLDQVPIAQVIRRFRDLDMPVDGVREVLGARDLKTRNKLIAAHLGALESKLTETQAAVATLRGLLQAEPAPIAVELRKVPATRALAIHAVVSRGELVAWWRGALGELEATCDAQQLVRTGAPGGTFGMAIFELERGDATVFVPIRGDARSVGRTAMATIRVRFGDALHQGPRQARHYVVTSTATATAKATARSTPNTHRILRVRSRVESARGRECLTVRSVRRLRCTRLMSLTTWSKGSLGS